MQIQKASHFLDQEPNVSVSIWGKKIPAQNHYIYRTIILKQYALEEKISPIQESREELTSNNKSTC